MGAVADVFDVVEDVVGDVVDAVVDIVTDVVVAISENVLTPEFLTIAAICIGQYYAIPAISAAYASAASTELAAYSVSMSAADAMIVGTSAFTSAVSAGLTAFAEAIHLTTILDIHNIATLVSSDYRNMMFNVYSEISEVSSALGFYPQFLPLAFRNSRQLVLSSSNLMGRKYDLAQVEWLTTFNSYLTEFNKHAKEYENNPEALFYDLEQLVEKPSMDAGGSTMQTVFVSINDTVKAVKATVADTVTVRDDLNRLISDLPERIRSQIKPYTDPIIRQFDDFITNTYDPAIKEFQSLLDRFSDLQKKNLSDIDDVVERLAKPGDYLLEIDSLLEADRLDQEGKIAEISTRRFRTDVDELAKEAVPISMQLTKLKALLEEKRIPPIWKVAEMEKPFRPAGVKAARRATWFVGDY